MITACATRRGTGDNNADAAAVHTIGWAGTTAAAVVDGIGHAPDTPGFARLAAEVAARVGARTTALIGILAAAELIRAPGGIDIEPDGVAVAAVAEPSGHTGIAWTGDARAYGWDGARLMCRTTDHTVGQYLRTNGAAPDLAAGHDNWLRTSLGRCTIATVHAAEVADPLIILTSDGVHDQVSPLVMDALAREHMGDPQALADALVAAARDTGGHRDDATAVVLTR